MPEITPADLAALLPFVLIGFLAQAVDGALGMAFGVIVNMIMVGFMGVPPAQASTHVHIVKCFTTAASGLSHYHEDNIDFALFWRLLLPGLVGGIAGAFLLSHVEGRLVEPFVLAYLLLTGIWLVARTIMAAPDIRKPKIVKPIGAAGGFLDAIGGGGWGPVVTSNLMVQGAEPRKVIGTVNSAEFFLTVTISAAFIVNLGVSDFVGPVFGLLFGGVIAAPLGALMARYFQPRVMFLLVGTVLTLISAIAIYRSLFE